MATLGTGTNAYFATSGFEGEILGSAWQDITREAFEVSTLETSEYKDFDPSSVTSPGTLTLELAFDPNAIPPVEDAVEIVKLSTPSNYWHAEMFVQSFTWGAPLEDKMTATIELKATGQIYFGSHTYLLNDSADIVYTFGDMSEIFV